FSAATARASAANRSENSVLDVLMATMRSSRVSRPFHTSPIPPLPSGATISKGPSVPPAERAIEGRLSLQDEQAEWRDDAGRTARCHDATIGSGVRQRAIVSLLRTERRDAGRDRARYFVESGIQFLGLRVQLRAVWFQARYCRIVQIVAEERDT